MTEIPTDEEAWAAIARVDRLLSEANEALRPDKVRGPKPHLVVVDEIADGWETLEQHALEQGWDDD